MLYLDLTEAENYLTVFYQKLREGLPANAFRFWRQRGPRQLLCRVTRWAHSQLSI